jgi:hypothetical protein
LDYPDSNYDRFAMRSFLELSDGEAEEMAAASRPTQPFKQLPMERAIVENTLCVRNTFLDFDDRPQPPAGASRPRSAPARPRRSGQLDNLNETVREDLSQAHLPHAPTILVASLGPTWGSILHASGRCKPCLFAHTGCRNGVTCTYWRSRGAPTRRLALGAGRS